MLHTFYRDVMPSLLEIQLSGLGDAVWIDHPRCYSLNHQKNFCLMNVLLNVCPSQSLKSGTPYLPQPIEQIYFISFNCVAEGDDGSYPVMLESASLGALQDTNMAGKWDCRGEKTALKAGISYAWKANPDRPTFVITQPFSLIVKTPAKFDPAKHQLRLYVSLKLQCSRRSVNYHIIPSYRSYLAKIQKSVGVKPSCAGNVGLWVMNRASWDCWRGGSMERVCIDNIQTHLINPESHQDWLEKIEVCPSYDGQEYAIPVY